MFVRHAILVTSCVVTQDMVPAAKGYSVSSIGLFLGTFLSHLGGEEAHLPICCSLHRDLPYELAIAQLFSGFHGTMQDRDQSYCF